jgi:hypothetical protein
MGRENDFILYTGFVLRARKSRDYLLVFSRQTADAKILLLIPVYLKMYKVICDKTYTQKNRRFNTSVAVKDSNVSKCELYMLFVKSEDIYHYKMLQVTNKLTCIT